MNLANISVFNSIAYYANITFMLHIKVQTKDTGSWGAEGPAAPPTGNLKNTVD